MQAQRQLLFHCAGPCWLNIYILPAAIYTFEYLWHVALNGRSDTASDTAVITTPQDVTLVHQYDSTSLVTLHATCVLSLCCCLLSKQHTTCFLLLCCCLKQHNYHTSICQTTTFSSARYVAVPHISLTLFFKSEQTTPWPKKVKYYCCCRLVDLIAAH